MPELGDDLHTVLMVSLISQSLGRKRGGKASTGLEIGVSRIWHLYPRLSGFQEDHRSVYERNVGTLKDLWVL